MAFICFTILVRWPEKKTYCEMRFFILNRNSYNFSPNNIQYNQGSFSG